ncbi:uncharacterized protein PG986_006387 [Apiospora aurea]|uniref:Uncharacterized protein n=1 Tax=Apiospora aurea TaxID=335848 RepID=A0ABR1QKB3_9PEZI
MRSRGSALLLIRCNSIAARSSQRQMVTNAFMGVEKILKEHSSAMGPEPVEEREAGTARFLRMWKNPAHAFGTDDDVMNVIICGGVLCKNPESTHAAIIRVLAVA